MVVEPCRSLPEHYERHLGKINRGWSDKAKSHGVQVISFKDQPEFGVVTFATLGLSRYVLKMVSGRAIRQELLVSANDTFGDADVAGFLLSLAEHTAETGVALVRGEIIGPGATIVSGSTLSAVYVTNPSPFDESLTRFECEPPPTVFAYLIPITVNEAALARKHGWTWFEGALERQNPDIWDLTRSEEVFAER